MIKLNLGCGMIRPANWINADSSLNTLIQKFSFGKWFARKVGAVMFETSNVVYMNLHKKWSAYADNSVDVVYASHLFEHLAIDKTKLFLAEAYRTLKPGGCIRLVMPDLYEHCTEYVKLIDEGKTDASKQLLKALNLYRRGPDDKVGLIHNVLGFCQGYPHMHKYMYDRLSLTKMYTDAGFKDIRLGEYGKSHFIAEINDVEGPHLYGGYPNSIYIEAIK